MKDTAPRGHLELLLLAVLRAGPAHGYGVVMAVRERSGGAFAFAEGTVYPALQKLEREGLLASDWDDTSPRRRRLYRLTREGRVALVEREAAWRRFTKGVSSVLAWAE